MTAPLTPPNHTPMRVLVTGGGGFVGGAVCALLRARGDHVRSYARGEYPELRDMGVEHVRADLLDSEPLRSAADGCDTVIHVAAKAGVWGPYREYYQANVRGTENVLEACRVTGVRRLVFTSSPSVVFAGHDIQGADESLPYPHRFASHYSETKALAEQAVLAADGPELRTVALRPHLVWGPRDNHIVPRLLARARAGHLRQVGDGRNIVDTTYIENAAAAHLLAADALSRPHTPAGGRVYFITNGQPLPLWDVINRILATADLPPVRRRISRRAAYTVGAALEAAHKLLRLRAEPRMTRFIANELATSHWFDISAARRDLDYEPHVSIEAGLEHLAAWLRSWEHEPHEH